MSNQEYRTISIRVYRTPDNEPTCQTKEGHCGFLRVTRLGTEHQCALQAGSREYLDRKFDRTVGEYGEYTYLIPFEMCPVWRKDNDS